MEIKTAKATDCVGLALGIAFPKTDFSCHRNNENAIPRDLSRTGTLFEYPSLHHQLTHSRRGVDHQSGAHQHRPLLLQMRVGTNMGRLDGSPSSAYRCERVYRAGSPDDVSSPGPTNVGHSACRGGWGQRWLGLDGSSSPVRRCDREHRVGSMDDVSRSGWSDLAVGCFGESRR